MSFLDLALVCTVALAGPLLATPRGWHLPVVLGELLAGVVLGVSGFGMLDASDPTFTFLGNCGFVLVMFVAGSRVPVRDARLRPALRTGVVRAARSAWPRPRWGTAWPGSSASPTRRCTPC